MKQIANGNANAKCTDAKMRNAKANLHKRDAKDAQCDGLHASSEYLMGERDVKWKFKLTDGRMRIMQQQAKSMAQTYIHTSLDLSIMSGTLTTLVSLRGSESAH